MNIKNEKINCPYCDCNKYKQWAEENRYTAVKCEECGLVYVNPRPVHFLIEEAVKTGIHSEVGHGRNAFARRVKSKPKYYKKLFSVMFHDVWEKKQSISWLDIGAGYGEIVEAINTLAAPGSRIEGIEPMKHKATNAQARGLNVKEKQLNEITEKYGFVSLVHVYSHIPNFRSFLKEIKDVMEPTGEFFFETGNIADLPDCSKVPSELDLPDHLCFAGEEHIKGYLREEGFEIIQLRRLRNDGLINFVKNMAKKILGRKVALSIPYTSCYRSFQIRAKLVRSNLNSIG